MEQAESYFRYLHNYLPALELWVVWRLKRHYEVYFPVSSRGTYTLAGHEETQGLPSGREGSNQMCSLLSEFHSLVYLHGFPNMYKHVLVVYLPPHH